MSAALIASGGLESGDASSVAVMQDLDSSPSPSVNQFPAQPYLGSYLFCCFAKIFSIQSPLEPKSGPEKPARETVAGFFMR
jgi:hypothetical protein